MITKLKHYQEDLLAELNKTAHHSTCLIDQLECSMLLKRHELNHLRWHKARLLQTLELVKVLQNYEYE